MRASTAVRVASWIEKHGDWPGVSTLPASPPAPTFPDAPLDLSVKILVDNSWIDITHFVYHRVDVQVARGRANETTRVDPATASWQVNNRDGQFSPRNPTSWLYGKIGRNTQVRIAIGADVRFTGEISEWPARWDVTGKDVYVPIQASGILRRLGQGASPLKSTMYRGYTAPGIFGPDPDAKPTAYWPCEDAVGATQLASALGGRPMVVTGTPTLASNTEFKCSEALPVLNNSEWNGEIPSYPATGFVGLWLLVSVPSGGATSGQTLVQIHLTGGTIRRCALVYTTGAGGQLTIKGFDDAGTEVANSGVVTLNLDGNPQRIALQLQTTGPGNLDWELKGQRLNGTIGGSSGTFASQTVSRAVRVQVNPGGGLGAVGFGHVAVHKAVRPVADLVTQFLAYSGEKAGRRIQRLCSEEAVAFRAVGDLDATTPVGAQLPAKLLDLLTEAADADMGILFEPRDILGLAYRTRENLYNQAPVLQLDYTSKHLSGIQPTDDDQQTRNDITVTRAGGSSFRATQDTGPLSVAAPPAGVGRYDVDVTLNLQADSQLDDAAGWRLHLGTVDEARYPELALDLARAPFVANPSLAATIQQLDVGDRLTVVHPPAWLPPDPITQLAQGFTETMNAFVHRVGINCSPESPWGQAAVYNSPASRYSADSTLAAGIDASATSLQVATVGVRLWSHADGDFNIRVGGEVMTVTAIAGTTSPQTFTVTRSVNSVVKAHASGEAVGLDHPVVYVP